MAKKKKKQLKALQKRLMVIETKGLKKVKSTCCKKYKKCETKRCARCPCHDLLKYVA